MAPGAKSRTSRRGAALSAVLAAGMVAVGGGLSPVGAAPVPVLVVRASSSAWATVTFPRSVTLRTRQATLMGGGAFAGFYVEPVRSSGVDGTGAVRFASWAWPSVKGVGPLPLGRELLARPHLVEHPPGHAGGVDDAVLDRGGLPGHQPAGGEVALELAVEITKRIDSARGV